MIRVKQGTISGVEYDNYILYKGIPYAKPPVGELRWKPPQEIENFGFFVADKFPNMAMQMEQKEGAFYKKEFYSNSNFIPNMSEDCLYLNIWVPKILSEKGFPIAFWIHGGAFTTGYGSEIEFDGEEYCKRGVILVTINYRLGPFGFLAHKLLTEESNHKVSGNYGIMDQIAALKWIYENISSFGGDKNKITVFGQSAGCYSTQILTASEFSKMMVNKAILQSCTGYKISTLINRSLKDAEQIGEDFMRPFHIQSVEEMRCIDSKEIINRVDNYFSEFKTKNPDGKCPFAPNIDNYIIPMNYDEIVDKGIHADIPYMIGSTERDLGVTANDLEEKNFGKLYNSILQWNYKNQDLGRSPSYIYYFQRRLPGDDSGAFHSGELWYTFGTLKRCWRPMEEIDYNLSKTMIDYWTNFIKTGNPNGRNLRTWCLCSKENKFVMNFGDNNANKKTNLKGLEELFYNNKK